MLSNYCIAAEIAAGVYETILTGIRANLTRLESTIDTLSDQVEEHSDTTELEFATSQAKLMTLASDLETVKEDSEKILEAHLYQCGGTYGWRRVVYLDMTDPNTNCPSGWNLTTYEPSGWELTTLKYDSKRMCGSVNTVDLTCDSWSFSQSLEETILVCVAPSEPTRMVHLSPTILDKQPQLTVPMFLVSVSHMALLDNTSGHLLLDLLRIGHTKMPVLVMLLLTLAYHHLWVETISVSQGFPTQDQSVAFIRMTLSGMAVDVLAPVAVAHSIILHTLLSNSPTLPLRPDCVNRMVVTTLHGTLCQVTKTYY